MEKALINLTYKNPCDDLQSCFAYNPDGTINVHLTLLTYRNLLNTNMEKINRLIEISNDIIVLMKLNLIKLKFQLKIV